MKRKVSLLLAVLLLVSAVCVLAACSVSYVKIAIKEGTLQTTVEFGGEVDYTGLVLVATDNDGNVTEINAYTDGKLTDGVKLDKIDTSTSGAKTFKVTYYGLAAQQVITVGEQSVEDKVTVLNVENTKGYTAYLGNKSEQTNKQEEFVNRDAAYVVGYDNGYRCAPVVTYDDGENTDVSDNFATVYKLYKKGETTPLSGDALTAVLRKVEDNVYYFTEDAKGLEFTLEISVDSKYKVLDEDTVTTVTQDIEVVAGYNVHDALDLSVWDNLNNKSWEEIKKAVRSWNEGKTLAEYKDVERVILHSEITIKKSDLPANYFWQKGEGSKGNGISYEDALSRTPAAYKDLLEGSVKETCLGEDWEENEHNNQRGLYTSTGIGLSGNYLKLTYEPGYTEVKDANGKTTAVTASDGGLYVVYDFNMDAGNTKTYPEVHTSLVAYRNYKDNTRTPVIENVYLTGKTNKTESGIGVVPAGLMMSHVNIDNTTMTNVVANRWFCNIEFDGTVTANKAGTLIDLSDCKFFDSFSQMIYCWYGRGINVTNCEMRNAGGPLLIIQTKGKDAPEYVTGGSSVKIDDASLSNMESWITGSEVWFEINNVPSATVTQLFALAGNIDATGTKFKKTVGDYTYYNAIAVIIPAPGKLNDADVATEGSFNVIPTAGGTKTDAYGTDEAVFNAILDLSSNASKAATLCEELVASFGDALGSDNKTLLTQASTGFKQLSAATAALQFAPLYKCGSLYAYGGLDEDTGTFTFNNVKEIVTNAAQLCAVMQQVADVLQSNINDCNAAADQCRAAGKTAEAEQYEAQAAALKSKLETASEIYVGTSALAEVSAQEDADWNAAWKANTQHFAGVYIRPNIDASKKCIGRLVAIFAENIAA